MWLQRTRCCTPMEASITSSPLRKKLSCSLCFKVYTEPKILQCLHTFCLPCLNKMAVKRPHGEPLKCPVCQANIHLPVGTTFENLPNSVHHQRLSELLVVKSPQRAAMRCGGCERNLPPISFCFDCRNFICRECLAAHQLRNTIKGHRYVALDEFKDEDIDDLLKRPNYCKINGHKHEVLKFFCDDCKTCICPRGAMVEHKHHRFVSVEKAAEKYRKATSEAAETVKAEIPVMRDNLRKMAEDLRSTRAQIESAKSQVHEQVEYLIRILRLHEATVLSELDDVYKNEQRHYEAEKNTKEIYLMQLGSAVEFADGVTKRNLVAEVMYIHSWVTHRCAQLSAMVKAASKPRRISVTYATNREYRVKAAHVTPGRVVITGDTQAASADTQRLPTQCVRTVRFPDTTNAYQPLLTFGSKGNGKGQLSFPWGIAVNSRKEVAVADSGNNRIQIFSSDGQHLKTFGCRGNANGQLKFPQGLTFDEEDNVIVADTSNSRIQVLTASGKFIKSFGANELHLPWGLCVNDDKCIAVCSGGRKPGVKVFTQDGTLIIQFNDRRRKGRPYYIAFGDGKYFVSYGNDRVVSVFNKVGRTLYTIGEHGYGQGQLLSSPYGLVIDKKNNLLVCDFANDCIQEFTMDGQFVSKLEVAKAGTLETLQKPLDLAISRSGQLFVSENGASRVHVLAYV